MFKPKVPRQKKRNEDSFETLANGSPVLLWINGLDGCEFVNREYLDFLGVEHQIDVRQYDWSRFVHPDDREKYLNEYIRAFECQKEFSSEFRFLRHDGQYRWMLSEARPRHGSDGTFLGYVGATTDITEQKEAEGRLTLLSEIGEFTRTITDVNELLLAVCTAVGQQLQVTRCLFNEIDVEQDRETVYDHYYRGVPSVSGVHKISDYSSTTSAEIQTGKTIVNCDSKLDPRTRDDYERTYEPNHERAYVAVPLFREKRWVATLWASDNIPREWSKHEVALLESVAEKTWAVVEKLRIDAILRKSRQELEALVGRLRDNQKQLQMALSEAEEASRLKDEFLATVSHELRTPLNAILGWSHMLQSKSVAPNTAASAIDAIYTSARNQAQIIDDLLDIARIISGKMNLRPEMVSLSQILTAAVNTVSHAIAAKNICLKMPFEHQPETISFYADPQRLQQVFWNLLSNSVKFTPAGGTIEIEVHRSESDVTVTITDTGIGIQPNFLPYVFERFRQEDSSTTRRYGGLGMGLSITKHLVELHGGTISAASQGKRPGSTFTVRLPLIYKKDEVPSGQSSSEKLDASERSVTKLKSMRVLLVDDDNNTLDLLREAFQNADAEIRTINSAGGAWDIIMNGWTPNVIISDIAMPEQDGYWLIRKIRALSTPLRFIPAIALTAYAAASDHAKALDEGFHMFVPKPVEPDEVLQATETLLHRRISGNRRSDAKAQSLLARKKVLLIEDDVLSTEVLMLAFKEEGMEARSASNAAKALEILKEWIPDIIISDLGLPDQDGYSLLKKIRTSEKLASVPAVALTGFGKEEGNKALAAGFQLYKSKPVEAAVLIALLEELMG